MRTQKGDLLMHLSNEFIQQLAADRQARLRAEAERVHRADRVRRPALDDRRSTAAA
jgi:hypothetical protein